MDAAKTAKELNTVHWTIDDILIQVVKARMGRVEYQQVVSELEAAMFHLDRAAELLRGIKT